MTIVNFSNVKKQDATATTSTSFLDYLMPTINMMPRIETTLVRGYPGAGPYGAKGAGEIACVPPMACIANAIDL